MNNKENFNSALILVLVVALIIAFSQINSLRSDIKMLDKDLANEKSRLENQISSIYTNVDNQLKKEASLFAHYEMNYGSFDNEAKTANISFTVLPKVITDDMKVNISVWGKSAEMKKMSNGEYLADISIDIFEKSDFRPIVTINSKDEIKTEILEMPNVYHIWTNYLPTIFNGNLRAATAGLRNGKLTVDGKLMVGYNLSKFNSDVKFTKYSLNIVVNGKEIATKDITNEINNYEMAENIERGTVEIPFKETYDLTNSDNLTIYLVAEDSLGYIHKRIAFGWKHPDTDGRHAEIAVPEQEIGEVIFDKEGNVLGNMEW